MEWKAFSGLCFNFNLWLWLINEDQAPYTSILDSRSLHAPYLQTVSAIDSLCTTGLKKYNIWSRQGFFYTKVNCDHQFNKTYTCISKKLGSRSLHTFEPMTLFQEVWAKKERENVDIDFSQIPSFTLIHQNLSKCIKSC